MQHQSKVYSASAGTGKTYQLTQRYMSLVNAGVDPSKILAITFTKKAAKEMKERILSAIDVEDLRVQTIDSLFHEWVREFPFEAFEQPFPLNWTLGSPQDFEVLREKAFNLIVDNIPKETFGMDILQIKSNIFKLLRYDRAKFQKFYSNSKNIDEELSYIFPEWRRFLTADEKKISSRKYTKKMREEFPTDEEKVQALLSERKLRFLDAQGEFLFSLYEKFRKAYEKLKYQNQILEFSDLTLGAYRILFHPESQGAAAQICRKYQHILIDEFQDTSLIQWKIFEQIILELISQTGTFFIVGDVKQSIYGFRDADPSIMLELEQRFDCERLNINRRSTGLVIDFVNQVFEHQMNNFYRHEAILNTHSEVQVVDEFETLEDQGKFIAEKICNLKDIRFKDIAILYRAQQNLEEILSALKKNKIPYHFVDDKLLYEDQRLHDLFALLKYSVRPDDRLSYESILKAGLKPPTPPLFVNHPFLLKIIYENNLIGSTVEYFLGAAAFYEKQGKNILDLIRDFESKTLHQNFAPSATHPDSVQLMTIHKSKGLEFDCVFVVNTSHRWARDERTFFKQRQGDEDFIYFIGTQEDQPHEHPAFEEIAAGLRNELFQESLRLMYVALTRAKNYLYVTATKNESRGIESTNLYELLPKFSESTTNKLIPEKIPTKYSDELPQVTQRNSFEYKVLAPSRLMSQVIPSEERSDERPGISSLNLGLSSIELGIQIHKGLENYFSDLPNNFSGELDQFFQKLIHHDGTQFLKNLYGQKMVEKSFCLLRGEKFYQGRIDLVMDSKEILVIDYKVLTQDISNEDLIQKYKPQLDVYLEFLGKIYRERMIESYIFAIRMDHNHELIKVGTGTCLSQNS